VISPFFHKGDLGKLPHQVTILSDWTSVAQLRLDKLLFPRKGGRTLQFETSVQSAETGQELALARCRFVYETRTSATWTSSRTPSERRCWPSRWHSPSAPPTTTCTVARST